MGNNPTYYRKDDFKRKRYHFYIKEEVAELFIKFCNESGISRSEIIELQICEIIGKSDIFSKWDIDIKKYINITKYEILRKFIKKMRNDLMSKSFFIRRLRLNLYKLVINNSSSEDINKFLTLSYKEAKLYNDNMDLLKEMHIYRKLSNNKIDELRELIKKNLTRGNLYIAKTEEERHFKKMLEHLKDGGKNEHTGNTRNTTEDI